MKVYAGIWVDHKKAFVVSVGEDRQAIERIDSNAEPHIRLSGGSRTRNSPYGPQDIAVDGKQDERRRQQLRIYYQQIIGQVKDASGIIIFGPGQAKQELQKEMLRSVDLASKIRLVEAADKMTERQIVAKVRDFFCPQE